MNVKKLFGIVFILFFCCALPAITHAQDKSKGNIGVYIGLVGGSSLSDDIKTKIDNTQNPADSFSVDFGMKSGYLAGAKIGWQTSFTKKILAMELEYNHINNNMENWTAFDGYKLDPHIPVDGKIQIDALFFNLLARYPDGPFHPYIGGGVGYSTVKVSDTTAHSGIIMNIGQGEQSSLAYQLTAGVDFDIAKHFTIGFGYKYIAIPKISFENSLDNAPASTEMEYYSHNFILSACFTF
ncbi:MAG: outer membrane beta-barrel protein [Smithellaceae bacterium]